MNVLTGIFQKVTKEQEKDILANGGKIEEREGLIYVYKERRTIQEEIEKQIHRSGR